MRACSAVMATTMSCSGSTTANWPNAPSPRYPCRATQKLNP